MIYTNNTEDTGDKDEIKEWESDLEMYETVMMTTPHRGAEKSHPFKG